MLHRFIVAIGAGCAAALLFIVSSQSSLLAMALAYLAPLPIMIATLGFGLDSGAIAGAISAAAILLLAEPLSALLFAASVALPAWALAAFAVTPVKKYFRPRSGEPPLFAPLGAVVMLATLIGILCSAAVTTAVIIIYGGYQPGVREVASAVAKAAAGAFEAAPDSATVRDFADALVRFGPLAVAGSTLVMLCVNLYGAARSTELSRNLPRPWPDIPTSLALPWPIGAAFLVALAGWYALPAPAGQYFSIVAGGLGTALALVGLAIAHALSRGLKMRPLMLVALYACCVLRAKYTLPVLAALGVIDGLLKLRSRAAFLPASTATRPRHK